MKMSALWVAICVSGPGQGRCRSLCLPSCLIHPSPAAEEPAPILLLADPRGVPRLIAVPVCPGIRRVFSVSLRVHTAKASVSSHPMARHSDTSRRASMYHSEPQQGYSTVPMCPPLRSKPSLFTTRGHNEQADTITQLGIGLHVGLNTAGGHVCRAVTQKGHNRATHPHIPQNQRGAKHLAS